MNRSTTNVLARGEVGRTSLQSDILALSIGYIKYLGNKPCSLVKSALEYESLLTEQRTTILSLFNIHENRLKTHLKNNEDIKTISKSKLKYIINEIFNSIWITQLNNYPKADTYKQFKTRLKFECYLNGKNRKLRVYTKLRVSDHKLMFEVGRRKRPPIPRDERFCPFCPLEIENESHFLLTCTKYKGRMELLNEIQGFFPRLNDNELDTHSKFIFLMCQEHTKTTNLLLNHVYKWQKTRDETLHHN